jgi:hypothetical protein
VRRVCSIFSQILQLFPRLEFEHLVRQHRAERHARGFTCWGQFVAMLFCQLGQAQSLREICGGLACCQGKLRHLGVPEAPKRSTLAYANEHRPWELYQSVFQALYQRCQQVAGKARRLRFRHPRVILDATMIDLCASLYDWARYKRTKGTVKLHLLLDHQGYLPRLAVITTGKVQEIEVARQLPFEPGTILIMDRAYVDYAWYERLTRQGVFFVTRLRHDAHFRVVEQRPVPERGPHPARSDDSPGQPLVSAASPAAPPGGGSSRGRSASGPAHQSPRLGPHHSGPSVPRALADRSLLPRPETELAS